jgi:hypothetical protein
MMRILIYVAAVAVAALLVWFDQRLFLLYAFAVFLWAICWGPDPMWKMLRVSHFSNAVKMMAVAQKLGVSEEDFEQAIAEMKAAEGSKRIEEVLVDYHDLR